MLFPATGDFEAFAFPPRRGAHQQWVAIAGEVPRAPPLAPRRQGPPSAPRSPGAEGERWVGARVQSAHWWPHVETLTSDPRFGLGPQLPRSPALAGPAPAPPRAGGR